MMLPKQKSQPWKCLYCLFSLFFTFGQGWIIPVSEFRCNFEASQLLSSKNVDTDRIQASSAWFSPMETNDDISIERGKAILLQLGAVLDRGQAYNPTSGSYYEDKMAVARENIQRFVDRHAENVPKSLTEISGEWELVLTTVNHGIFRSSPFFLAIQESYETYAEEKEAFSMKKADLFFKLHELQTCSWGVSKIGRVAQHISPSSGSETEGMLFSEFDTSIFSLTVIPILGWFKLLPTFGGCVVTAASCKLKNQGLLEMKVDYTTARKVPGLQGLPFFGDFLWKIRVPVGAIWKLLPWNKGRDADCRVFVRYVDDDFRIVQDTSGDYFVYTRPVVPRALDLAESMA